MASSYEHHAVPINTEDFRSPAHCAYKIVTHKPGEFPKHPGQTLEPEYDKERMVCATTLDYHTYTDEFIQRNGATYPKNRSISTRMNGPACPIRYAGLVQNAYEPEAFTDPVTFARKREYVRNTSNSKLEPYTPLCNTVDPRRISKTVVFRDYLCKHGVDMANMETLARAILVNYTDQYVSFLSEFVSNLFGEKMRRYLQTLEKGYALLLAEKEHLLSSYGWKAYVGARGGIEDTAYDKSLKLEREVGSLLSAGSAISSKMNAYGHYDMRPCIEQHVHTLKRMRKDFCKGFASDEVSVIKMMYYAQEQALKWTEDLRMVTSDGKFEGKHVWGAVPRGRPKGANNPDGSSKNNLFQHYHGAAFNSVAGSHHHSFSSHVQRYREQATHLVHIGDWCGSKHGVLGQKGPFRWGWGHSCNLLLCVDGAEDVLSGYSSHSDRTESSTMVLNRVIEPEPFAHSSEAPLTESLLKIEDRVFGSLPTVNDNNRAAAQSEIETFTYDDPSKTCVQKDSSTHGFRVPTTYDHLSLNISNLDTKIESCITQKSLDSLTTDNTILNPADDSKFLKDLNRMTRDVEEHILNAVDRYDPSSPTNICSGHGRKCQCNSFKT